MRKAPPDALTVPAFSELVRSRARILDEDRLLIDDERLAGNDGRGRPIQAVHCHAGRRCDGCAAAVMAPPDRCIERPVPRGDGTSWSARAEPAAPTQASPPPEVR